MKAGNHHAGAQSDSLGHHCCGREDGQRVSRLPIRGRPRRAPGVKESRGATGNNGRSQAQILSNPGTFGCAGYLSDVVPQINAHPLGQAKSKSHRHCASSARNSVPPTTMAVRVVMLLH